MSRPNHKPQRDQSPVAPNADVQSGSPWGEELEPWAAGLAQLQPFTPRPLAHKVFYEMGYQAGCRAIATKPRSNPIGQSSLKRYGLAAACISLALAGGFWAGQWRAQSETHASPGTLAYTPPELTGKDAQQPEAPTTAHASSATAEPPKIKSPRGWSAVAKSQLPTQQLAGAHWLSRQLSGPSGQIRSGMRIGPVGSAWEDLVISAESSPSKTVPELDPVLPLVDVELQQILRLTTPHPQPVGVQRLKKWMYPLL